MNKSNYVKIISISLVAMVIFGGAALYYGMKSAKYEKHILHMSDRAYSEIISSLSNVGTNLEKLKFAGDGPYLNSLAAQIWREASIAKASLSLLPLGDVKLDQTEKFIAQAGEYAYSILRRGGNEDTGGNVEALTQTATDLTQKLWSVKERVNKGELTFESMDSRGSFSSGEMSDNISQVEEEFPQMGTLIYDGPFSDHLEKITPALLEGANDVTVQVALENAKAFTQNTSLVPASEGGDKIPVYIFTSDDGTSIQMTKKGGYVLQMTRPAKAQAANLSAKDAVRTAKEFFDKNGYTGMKESYYTIFENMITINFAYSENNIIAYPDLIKVGVDLDSGNIISFESRGYVMNHKSRTLSEPKTTFDQAEGVLSADLQVLSKSFAIVPTSGGKETFCFEFLCISPDEQKVIIYIDTQTGREENMLVLIEDENGTLTM